MHIKTAEQHTAIHWLWTLVHWPLVGGLLHLVQQGGAWVACGPARYTIDLLADVLRLLPRFQSAAALAEWMNGRSFSSRTF